MAYIFLRNLFAVVMLSGMFSLTAAVLYVVMDAVDVAFTEAAVGAGIATVLDLRREFGPAPGDLHRPEHYIDTTYLEAARNR